MTAGVLTVTSLNPADLWTSVQSVQSRSRSRNLDLSDVRLFVDLVQQAELLCHEYSVERTSISVRVDGGAVCNSYKYGAETTILSYSVERTDAGDCPVIKVFRGWAEKRPYGNKATCGRVLVPGGHPARQALKNVGLIDGGDRYARVYAQTSVIPAQCVSCQFLNTDASARRFLHCVPCPAGPTDSPCREFAAMPTSIGA